MPPQVLYTPICYYCKVINFFTNLIEYIILIFFALF